MGTGAEGEVRPCAWKWEWKLKSKVENEEGGPRSSKQQERREKSERERSGEREHPAEGEWCPVEITD